MEHSILVIDNDQSAVELLSVFFQQHDFSVYTALDGATGVALARAHKPAVIICDILLDQMHGFEVIQNIRAHPELSRAIVIVISAKSYKPDIDRAKALGANEYLVKPINVDELLTSVERHLAPRTAQQMRVTFWGTRGSIATPGPSTTLYGGNTSCVEMRSGSDIVIFDSGTGIRELGLSLMKEFQGAPLTVHLFISHTHWDHIQGFPFFVPAYAASTTIHLYGSAGQGRSLEKLLRGQMNADYFPVALGDLASSIHVHEYRGEDFQIGEITVSAMYLNHPGMTLGYKVTHAGKTLVYATDNEPYRYTLEHLGQRAEAGKYFGKQLDEKFVNFVSAADLYIGEAQYTDDEYPAKIGWGHSSVSATVETALQANVRLLALFHHDPMHSDEVIFAMVEAAKRLIVTRGSSLECFAAREGQTIEV